MSSRTSGLQKQRQKSVYNLREKKLSLTPEQSHTFLTMYLRRAARKEHGRRKNDTLRTALMVCLIVFLLAAATDTSDEQEITTVDSTTGEEREQVMFIFDLYAFIGIGAFILLGIILTAVLKNTKVINLLYWVLFYLPVFFGIISSFIPREKKENGWIAYAYMATSVLATLIFLFTNYGYPKLIKTARFRQTVDVASFFSINLVSDTDWIMSYGGAGFHTCRKLISGRHTCKYDGDKNRKGEPDGYGFWFDDNFDGELLSGYWENGEPVAPFLSRTYGTGDTIRAVRIAYFLARDEEHIADSWWFPKNENKARCGVASVECSIQGSFFRHLPEATELIEARVIDDSNSETVTKCVRELICIETSDQSQRSRYVTISTVDSRGIQVQGQVYKPTGEPYTKEPDEIVVHVRRGKVDIESERSEADMEKQIYRSILRQPSRFMPKGLSSTERVLIDESEELKADDEKQEDEDYSKMDISLEVDNWIPQRKKAALIFFPGFNSPTKKCLESLGQLMAMSGLTTHVHPILFSWPTGQSLTYRYSSSAATSKRNAEHLLELLQGLKSAGIRDFHLMTHSMGVQSLLGCFEDNEDGSRSDVSKVFELDPDFGGEEEGERDDNNKSDRALCRSITLMNPDFPLHAFVNHAFLTIRRICSHITVIGDRQDGALFYSQLINGLCDWWGLKQSKVLNPNKEEEIEKRGFHFQLRTGRDIDQLYVKEAAAITTDEKKNTAETETDGFLDEEKEESGGSNNSRPVAIDERLLYKGKPPIVLRHDSDAGEDDEKLWLDIDVIDTTNLDTNIEGLRHSAYNVNSILLKDLEELIVNGERAINRTSLLYREGNTFSFCHAPSFVAM